MPIRGRESRRSVQAQDPYGQSKEAAAAEQILSRLKRVSVKTYLVTWEIVRYCT